MKYEPLGQFGRLNVVTRVKKYLALHFIFNHLTRQLSGMRFTIEIIAYLACLLPRLVMPTARGIWPLSFFHPIHDVMCEVKKKLLLTSFN